MNSDNNAATEGDDGRPRRSICRSETLAPPSEAPSMEPLPMKDMSGSDQSGLQTTESASGGAAPARAILVSFLVDDANASVGSANGGASIVTLSQGPSPDGSTHRPPAGQAASSGNGTAMAPQDHVLSSTLLGEHNHHFNQEEQRGHGQRRSMVFRTGGLSRGGQPVQPCSSLLADAPTGRAAWAVPALVGGPTRALAGGASVGGSSLVSLREGQASLLSMAGTPRGSATATMTTLHAPAVDPSTAADAMPSLFNVLLGTSGPPSAPCSHASMSAVSLALPTERDRPDDPEHAAAARRIMGEVEVLRERRRTVARSPHESTGAGADAALWHPIVELGGDIFGGSGVLSGHTGSNLGSLTTTGPGGGILPLMLPSPHAGNHSLLSNASSRRLTSEGQGSSSDRAATSSGTPSTGLLRSGTSLSPVLSSNPPHHTTSSSTTSSGRFFSSRFVRGGSAIRDTELPPPVTVTAAQEVAGPRAVPEDRAVLRRDNGSAPWSSPPAHSPRMDDPGCEID